MFTEYGIESTRHGWILFAVYNGEKFYFTDTRYDADPAFQYLTKEKELATTFSTKELAIEVFSYTF